MLQDGGIVACQKMGKKGVEPIFTDKVEKK